VHFIVWAEIRRARDIGGRSLACTERHGGVPPEDRRQPTVRNITQRPIWGPRIPGSMSKVLTIAGLIVSILMIVLFALDMFAGFPFAGMSTMMDVAFMICGAVLAYLSWSTMRELR
jgi:hypothetical protein